MMRKRKMRLRVLLRNWAISCWQFILQERTYQRLRDLKRYLPEYHQLETRIIKL